MRSYRQLADAVLRRGQSQCYDHAVRDLIAAERLVPNAEDWQGHPPQEAYRHQVATEHRQKRAFWEKMGRAGLLWRRLNKSLPLHSGSRIVPFLACLGDIE